MWALQVADNNINKQQKFNSHNLPSTKEEEIE